MNRARLHILSRAVLAAAYLAAGLVHLLKPRVFMPVMPGWVPFPHQVIVATGLCEVAGAAALLVPRLRRLAGIMLALYAVCVFPANIKHAQHDLLTGTGLGLGYHLPRLLAQPLIVWWALAAGGVLRRRKAGPGPHGT